MAKITKSFYDWCIENGKEEFLNPLKVENIDELIKNQVFNCELEWYNRN